MKLLMIYADKFAYKTSVKNLESASTSDEERVIEHAVKGMIPHNKLGRRILKNLHVYAGGEHPHQAQEPEMVRLEE